VELEAGLLCRKSWYSPRRQKSKAMVLPSGLMKVALGIPECWSGCGYRLFGGHGEYLAVGFKDGTGAGGESPGLDLISRMEPDGRKVGSSP